MEFITKRIIEIAEVVGGGTPSTNNESYWGGDIPWISPADLTGYKSVYISNGEKFITLEGIKKSGAQKLPAGTVLFSSRAPIGYIAIAKDEIYTNQGFKSLICKPQVINNLYLYYYLKLNLDYVKNFASGSTFPELSAGRIKNIKITFCKSLDTQQKIASILSAYDSLIENNQKRIKILEQMAENLYKEWFVRFRFPGYENAEFEDGIPKGWKKIALDSALSKITTGLNPRKNFELGHGENYYVTIKNLGDNTLYLDEKCDKVDDEAITKINKRSDLQIGDILFSGIGTIGRTYLIDIPTKNWNVSESVFTLRANHLVSKEYLYMLLLSDDLQNFCQLHSQGVAQMGIRMAELKSYRFALPCKEIIEQFTAQVFHLLQFVSQLRKTNNTLTTQRDLLLPRLMSGKLSV